MKNSTQALWGRTDKLRGLLDTKDLVSAMSQLAVMVKVGQDNADFGDRLYQFISGGGYIKDLIIESIAAIDSGAQAEPRVLIDISDKCWSALPTDAVVEILNEITRPDHSVQDIVIFVMSLMNQNRSGFFAAPLELVSFMAGLIPDTETLYLPSDLSAIAGLSIIKPDQKLVLRVSSSELAKILRRLYFAMGKKFTLEVRPPLAKHETLPNWPVLLFPTFDRKPDKSIDRQLPEELQGPGRLTSEEAAVAAVASSGNNMVVALVSSGVLFRGGRSRQFRKWLIEQQGLKAVITLPAGMLDKTGIASAVLVIDPSNLRTWVPGKVLLFSAEDGQLVTEVRRGHFVLSGWEDLCGTVIGAILLANEDFVSRKTLAKNDYVLQPKRYRAGRDSGLLDLLGDTPVVSLDAIADIRTPLAVKTSRNAKGREFHEVRISDFEVDGTIRRGSRSILVAAAEVNRIENQVLRPGDILIGTRGTIGKCAVVDEDAPINLVAGQTITIIRTKSDQPGGAISIHPVVLFRYLSLPQVRAFLGSLTGGATISFLKKKDLANLSVPVPTADQQNQILEIHGRILAAMEESRRQMCIAEELSNDVFSDFVGSH